MICTFPLKRFCYIRNGMADMSIDVKSWQGRKIKRASVFKELQLLGSEILQALLAT